MASLTIYKNRTNRVLFKSGVDAPEDEWYSEIRVGKTQDSDLIVAWTFEPVDGGDPGDFLISIDDSLLQDVSHSRGYMDIKRISAGEPLPVLKDIIIVKFKDTVTA